MLLTLVAGTVSNVLPDQGCGEGRKITPSQSYLSQVGLEVTFHSEHEHLPCAYKVLEEGSDKDLVLLFCGTVRTAGNSEVLNSPIDHSVLVSNIWHTLIHAGDG